MKERIYVLILIVSLVNLNALSQVVGSEKSSIRLKTTKEVEPLDELPPVITIISPNISEEEIITSQDNDIDIIGHITDKSKIKTLFINGKITELTDDNLFLSKFSLDEGDNEISIVAIDQYGNFQESKLNIKYAPEIVFRTINGKGKYYALLIGIDQYQDPAIPNLDNPIKNAQTLYEVLTSNYIFKEENVTLLENVEREDIIQILDELAVKITPNDNLLIFYAGHGWWDEKANIGYWLPADAKQVNKAAWFRNSTLSDYMKAIESKHTLLIADACFGGSIFKTRRAFSDADKAINLLYELQSRKAMTSGTLSEVPDRSAFVKYLIERLSENTDKYLTSEQLFSSFRMAVINNSDVVPQYGEIRNVGDEGGDFIFIKK